jgi:hypothetical protein
MDNISKYTQRIFLLQKILRMIRVIALFIMFAFLLDDNEWRITNPENNIEEQKIETTNQEQQKSLNISNLDECLIRKSNKINLVGSLIALLVILTTIPIELIFVRCPKCRRYIWTIATPNFCAKCGQKFNKQ